MRFQPYQCPLISSSPALALEAISPSPLGIRLIDGLPHQVSLMSKETVPVALPPCQDPTGSRPCEVFVQVFL